MGNLFDIRLLEHKYRSGELTKEAYERHLASLPDSAHNTVPLNEDYVDEGDDFEEVDLDEEEDQEDQEDEAGDESGDPDSGNL